jgi:hypothetical protein
VTSYTDIQYLHTHDTTESTTASSSGSQTTVLGGFVPGRRYWVMARCSISSDNTSFGQGGAAVELWDATNDQQMVGSYGLRHPQNASHFQQWSYSAVFTAGFEDTGESSVNDRHRIYTRLSVETPGDTAQQDDTTITAIDITDLVEGRDYFYVENTTAINNSTSFARRADITIDVPASGANDGDWAVYGFAKLDLGNYASNKNSHVKLNCTHGSTLETPETINEPESTDEFVNGVFGRIYSLATSTSTTARFTVLTKDAASHISPHQHEASTIFGLRLNSFRTKGSSYTATANQSTSTSFVTTDTVASIEHVDPGDNKYMILAMGVFAAESTARNVKWQINQASTTIGDFDVYTNTVSSDRSHDGADETPFALMIPTTVANGSDSNTFILQYKKDSSAEYGVKDTGLAVFRLQVPHDTYVWNGSAGDGNIETEANWTPSGYPKQADRCVFNSGSVNATAGTLLVKSVHIASGYAGLISSGASFKCLSMNIQSQEAKAKMTADGSGRYTDAGVEVDQSVYITLGSLSNEDMKISAGTSGANCCIKGVSSQIELLGENWNRVVSESILAPVSVKLSGNVASLVVLGRGEFSSYGTLAKAWLSGPCRFNVEDSKVTLAYMDHPSAMYTWKSDETNGTVHVYSGVFNLAEATNVYNSSGLTVWGDRSVIDARTGIDGFKQPTLVFKWYADSARLLLDAGTTVTPS